MGNGSKISSVICRIVELFSAAIVVGLVGEYLHYVADAHENAGPRTVYTEALAGISLFFSIVYLPPLKYSFYGFFIDFSLFICWMVAFGLLDNLTPGPACTSYWYWNNWGYFWGRYYTIPNVHVTQSLVGRTACNKWRATLAFSFIGGIFWLITGCIGLYVCLAGFEDKNPSHWYRRRSRTAGISDTDAGNGTTEENKDTSNTAV